MPIGPNKYSGFRNVLRNTEYPQIPPTVQAPPPPPQFEVAAEIVPSAAVARPHIPRPRNAFILFRCHYVKVRKRVSTQPVEQAVMSRGASAVWKNMGETQRLPYYNMAKAEKEAHALRYPHYRYEPRSSRTGKAKTTGKQKPKISIPEFDTHGPNCAQNGLVPDKIETVEVSPSPSLNFLITDLSNIPTTHNALSLCQDPPIQLKSFPWPSTSADIPISLCHQSDILSPSTSSLEPWNCWQQDMLEFEAPTSDYGFFCNWD